MNTERLVKLQQVVSRVPVEDVRMGQWFCGTSACALGHYTLSTEGHEDGWRIYKHDHHLSSEPEWNGNDGPWYGYQAAMFYFDIDMDTSEYLFNPSCYERFKPNKQSFLRRLGELITMGEKTFLARVEGGSI